MPNSLLFSKLDIRNVSFRNRLWVSPMCQYWCLDDDGVPNDWHLMHLGRFAAGGAGLVMAEATGVNPAGRISGECTGIWNDTQRDAWARIVNLIHQQGAAAGIQLAHAGRKASTHWPHGPKVDQTRPVDEGGWQTVAPSAVAFPGLATPLALTVEGIDQVVADFAAAASRAVQAGFDVVEVHSAHGYLLHEFLSPLSNFRTDHYGGSLENRGRILVRIVTEVRRAVGEKVPVFVRLSGTDWIEGGLTIEEVATICGWCAKAGADLFDISSGGMLPAKISSHNGYQAKLSQHVRQYAGVRTSAVGLITTGKHAEQLLQDGAADAIMAAREFLRDPNFVFRAAEELAETVTYWPPQMRDATRHPRAHHNEAVPA